MQTHLTKKPCRCGRYQFPHRHDTHKCIEHVCSACGEECSIREGSEWSPDAGKYLAFAVSDCCSAELEE